MSDEIEIVTKDATVKERHHHKHDHTHYEEGKKTMAEPINVFTSPMAGGLGNYGGFGGNDGLGLGGGLIGGLVLGSLLRNNGGGLFGGGSGDGGSAVNNLQGSIDTTAILSQIADVKASVPLAEAQVQLALAGVQNALSNEMSQQTLALAQGQTAIQLAQAAATHSLSTEIAGVALSGERNSWAITQAINCDGDKTRALINQIDRENLNRLITTQANEIVELRADAGRAADRHGIEITMTNNQNQNQMQFQAQAQAITSIGHLLADVSQVARATNSNVIVGNTGQTSTGTQTASPTNVRA